MAVALYHSFVDLGLSQTTLDAAHVALPAEAREADRRVWQRTYTAMPAETHPHLAAVGELLRNEMGRSAYPQILELFLDAAAIRLP